MNKRILLSLLMVFGSYSCHAVLEEKNVDRIIKDLKNATEQEKPGYYADALSELKDSGLDSNRKKQILEEVNREIGSPPFCVFWDKSFEEICTLVNAEMAFISAARDRNVDSYETSFIIGIASLSFLSGEELTAAGWYVQTGYWPDAPVTLGEMIMNAKELLEKIAANY